MQPAQFLNFLDVSRASALETKSLLRKGPAVGFRDENEFTRLDRHATGAVEAIAEFQQHLRSPQARRNANHFRPTGLKEGAEP